MSLSKLVKTSQKKKKRIGRGYGSGRGGHTVGKGKYGQKSRGKVPLFFEGTKLKKSLLKRLPLLRGKGKFKPMTRKPLVVNIKYLNLFKKGEVVNLESLVEKGIFNKEEAKRFGVKILGEGELSVSLKVQLPVSSGARKKIEASGGMIEEAKGSGPAKEKTLPLKVKPKKENNV